MSEHLLIWLFGGLCVWSAALSMSIFRLFLTVTRITAVLLTVSKQAAAVLHHEDDRYAIDRLLEKYIERHHDLSFDEWQELFAKTKAIIDNPEIAKGERIAATLLHDLARFCNELSQHKLALKPVGIPSKKP